MSELVAMDQWERIFEDSLQTLAAARPGACRVPAGMSEIIADAALLADAAVAKVSERERSTVAERPSTGEERQQQKVWSFQRSGIDVSQYQGPINWQTVDKEKKFLFAYSKASEGAHYQDPMFQTNFRGSRNLGLRRTSPGSSWLDKAGAYHFFHPSIDPASQARNFAATMNTVGAFNSGVLRPVVDVEEYRREWATIGAGIGCEMVARFLDSMNKQLGFYPILYTSVAFANEWLGNLDVSMIPAFWLAEWIPAGAVPTVNGGVTLALTSPPPMPLNWPASKLKLWQYSAAGSVSGISGPVDLDLFLGADLSEITI